MNAFEVLQRLFPDLEALRPSGFACRCPLHPASECRVLFFDADGWLQGCSSGVCSRGDALSAALVLRAAA